MKDWIENAASMFCRAEIRRFNYDDRQPDGGREPHSQDSSGGRSHSVLPYFSNQKCGARLSGRVSMSIMPIHHESTLEAPSVVIQCVVCRWSRIVKMRMCER